MGLQIRCRQSFIPYSDISPKVVQLSLLFISPLAISPNYETRCKDYFRVCKIPAGMVTWYVTCHGTCDI